MIIKTSILLTSLCLASAAFGVLPPLAQSTRELQSLVSDSRLPQLLGSAEPIRDIVKTDTGYVVITPSRFLKVEVEYLPAGRPGPAVFKLHFYDPVDLKGVGEKTE